jgi:UDP-N-acetylmuramate-alanine ligase
MRAIERATEIAAAHDIIVTMGAGNVTSLAPQILALLNED